MVNFIITQKYFKLSIAKIFLFFLSLNYNLHAQGGKVVPDDLDCRNLPAKYEQYREYCRNVDFIKQEVKKIEEKSPANNDYTIVLEINTLKDKGWDHVKKKDYTNALKYSNLGT